MQHMCSFGKGGDGDCSAEEINGKLRAVSGRGGGDISSEGGTVSCAESGGLQVVMAVVLESGGWVVFWQLFRR